VVLPIRMPKGVPSQLFDPAALTRDDLIRTLRRAATSLQQIHSKGYSVSNWRENQVFISAQGDVEFIDIANTQPSKDDLVGFSRCFQHLAKHLNDPMIRLWFARTSQEQNTTLDELRADLSSLLNTRALNRKTSHAEPIMNTDVGTINHRYQLLEKIRQGDRSSVWSAWHMLGEFSCCISVYHHIEQHWLALSDHYRRLKDLYHPNIERFIELGHINNSEDVFLSRERVTGQSLRHLRDDINPTQAAIWFDQLLSALHYLHGFDLFHGGISLRNIICCNDKATLVNFGLGLDAVGDSQLRAAVDDEIWALEEDGQKDMFGLVASFIIALTKDEFPTNVSLNGLHHMLASVPDSFLTPERNTLFNKTLDLLR